MKINLTHLFQTITLFIFMTIIGTLSHEFGHILVARYYGYETQLHFGSASFKGGKFNELNKIFKRNSIAIINHTNFTERENFEELQSKIKAENLFIRWGGPLQTMLTGSIGFILLLLYRKKDNWIQWVLIYLSLFWTREVFNFIHYIVNTIFLGKNSKGDEMKIAKYYGFPEWSLISLFALIGFIICTYTIFYIVPKEKRNSFILGGSIGGILGFYLWMKQIGPILLP